MIHGGYKIMGMHFKSWLIDYKIWCSFLLAIGFIVYNLRNYVLFANAFGNGLQVLELYIANGNKSNSYIGVVIGCLFMLSDAPFTTSRSKYEVLRTGKLTWVKSQLAYIILSVVIYNILYLLLACIYSCISCPVGFNNEWSYTFRNLAIQQPDLAVWEYKISFPFPNVILEMDPWLAAVMTLIYNVAYILCLCLVTAVINMYSNKNFGWLVASGIHVAGYVAKASSGLTRFRFPFFEYAHFAQWFTDWESVFIPTITFLIIILSLVYISFKLTANLEV